MADHLPVFLMRYGGLWNDVTADVSQVAPLKITAGAGEVSDAMKATKVELTFEDPDGVYRVHDAASPLYGVAGRNTPLYVADDVQTVTFESSSIGVPVAQGTYPWARSTTSPHSGSWCYKSGAAIASTYSDVTLFVPTGANMCTLWYRTDCHESDSLRIYSRGVLRAQATGVGGAWTQVAIPLPPYSNGAVQLALHYLKDGATTAGADAVYIDDIRFMTSRAAVEVSSWRPDRTLGFDRDTRRGRQSCEITAEGLLRRVGSWTEPLQSAMTRQILGRTTLLGAWTGEDGSNATAASNLVAGGLPALARDVRFGEDESPGGGSTSMEISTGSQLTGNFPSRGSAWQIAFAFRLAAVPSGSALNLFSWVCSNGYTWQLGVNSTSFRLDITTNDGTSLVSSGVLYGAGVSPDRWTTMRMRTSISAGTVTYEWSWYNEGTGTYGVTGFYSGSIGRLQRWTVTGNAYLDGSHFAYIYAIDNATENLTDTATTDSFSGFVGERAGDRFLRIMGEEGLAGTLLGASLETELMGPQRPETLYDLLREIRDTDGGLVFDSPGEVGITFRTRESIYDQVPALALTYGTNVAPPLVPELDDLGTANQVTVTQRDGGSAVAVDDTTSMSVLPPPAGVGLYKRDLDVNVSSEARLPQLASWWKGIGTVPGARYPSVTVDLDANPELEAVASRVRPGDRATIGGLDADTVDLLVMVRADKQDNQKRRTITYACVPFRQYNVAVYDVGDRYGSRATTLNVGYSSTATTMVFRFAEPADGWSTASAPYDVEIAGERVRVTAMAARAGTGPYTQSATVTRSINGVVKAQSAGAPVNIHPDQAARYAL